MHGLIYTVQLSLHLWLSHYWFFVYTWTLWYVVWRFVYFSSFPPHCTNGHTHLHKPNFSVYTGEWPHLFRVSSQVSDTAEQHSHTHRHWLFVFHFPCSHTHWALPVCFVAWIDWEHSHVVEEALVSEEKVSMEKGEWRSGRASKGLWLWTGGGGGSWTRPQDQIWETNPSYWGKSHSLTNSRPAKRTAARPSSTHVFLSWFHTGDHMSF